MKMKNKIKYYVNNSNTVAVFIKFTDGKDQKDLRFFCYSNFFLVDNFFPRVSL